MVRMNIWLFEMSEAITIWILNINLFQKCGLETIEKAEFQMQIFSSVQSKNEYLTV